MKKQVDMSEKAIMSRLRQVDKLRELCLALMKAKKLQDKNSNENEKSNKVLKSKVDEKQSAIK